ncbi:DUF502 domain-containing protein [Thermosyntropha sp.]|uniref:DUF502 domain-containing protein n=1 Tax=Thermosyntropha sp. TaxID=2740820 RepID=UPI0025CFF851|nr:DUF502 domain-containing protein [Thermosyntropha sp.]MBO8159899.1 DUF502 domain-containing protein [Thermosyntropha sp.]
MRRLASLFLAGLATLLPLVISIYFIYWIFKTVDSILAPVLKHYIGHTIPGLGFLITITLVILIGLISTNIAGRKIITWWENLFIQIPLLGKIYGTVKRITSSLFSKEKSSFRQVALIEFPRPGIYSLAFVTNDEVPFMEEEVYTLFVPTTPNPTSGWFIIMPKDKVRILDIGVDRGIEMVISAGMVNGNNFYQNK